MIDEKTTGQPLDSHILYPSMMQTTRLLILDYDVTRYHSFDVFRYLLLDKDFFMKCKKEFYPIIKEGDYWDKVVFYMENCPNFNPFDNFEDAKALSIFDVDRMINDTLGQENIQVTRTDLDKQFDVVFDKPTINGFLLQYKNDKPPSFSEKVKRYESDRILDLRMAMAIIQKENINAIMVSSVDLAVLIAQRMMKHKIERSMTFIIGNYWYNYDPSTKLMRHMQMMNLFELKKKHEFGIFDPYGSLHYKRKLEQESSNDQSSV